MTGPRDAGFVTDAHDRVWQRMGNLWHCLTHNLPGRDWHELDRPLDVFVWRGTEHEEH